MQKKYVESAYGKEYYKEYAKEKWDKSSIDELDKPDKIIEELLQIKRSELKSCQDNMGNSYITPTKTDTEKESSHQTEAMFNKWTSAQNSIRYRQTFGY